MLSILWFLVKLAITLAIFALLLYVAQMAIGEMCKEKDQYGDVEDK